MNAAIYSRVSTKAQAEDGTSLASQEASCRKLAKQRGFVVTDVFREDWPGDSLDRPQLREVRAAVAGRRYDALICHATDRLARNPIHIAIIAEECDKAGVALLFVTEPLDNSAEGQLIRYVRGFAAQVEREKIRERTVRGKQARAASGRLPQGTGRGAYGYRYDPVRGVREVHDEEAAVVRRIFRCIADGATCHAVAVQLNRDEIPAQSGGVWYPLTIRRLVENTIYKGETTYGKTKRISLGGRRRRLEQRDPSEWITIPGASPAIVTLEEFDAAQRARESGGHTRRPSSSTYFLTGHVYCGYCGGRLHGATMSGRYRYYACRMTSPQYRPNAKCPAKYVRADELEAKVWEYLSSVVSRPEVVLAELRRRREADTGPLDAELVRVEKELKSLRDQHHRLIRLYQYAEIDDEYMARQLKSLKTRETVAEAEQARLQELQRSLTDLDELEVHVGDWATRVSANLAGMDLEDRQLLLRALEVRVVVTPERWEIHGALPACEGDSRAYTTIERTSASPRVCSPRYPWA